MLTGARVSETSSPAVFGTDDEHAGRLFRVDLDLASPGVMFFSTTEGTDESGMPYVQHSLIRATGCDDVHNADVILESKRLIERHMRSGQ